MAVVYTYLVAGLPDVSFEMDVRNFDYERLMQTISERLETDDTKYFRLLLMGLETPVPFFYKTITKSRNRLLREYFAFDVLLRNIQAGLAARKLNTSAESYLIGENALTEAILKSKASDFGLSLEMEEVAEIIRVFELPDLLEREQKLDGLRWNKVEKIALFNYFDIDAVLAFVVKAFLVNRWIILDKERGVAMFKQLLHECRGEAEYVKMPE